MKLLHILCLSGAMALQYGDYITNTVLEKVRKPGVVAVLGKHCPNSAILKKKLNDEHIAYEPLYVEENLDLKNYSMSHNNSKIPMLFENGVMISDINGYLRMHRNQIK